MFDAFVCKVCEEHFRNIYSRNGVSKTFARQVKGDFLKEVISSLKKNKTSERLRVLVGELQKLPTNGNGA